MDVILPTTLDATSLDALQAQLEVRADVLVLRGQGDVFCHGLSLRAAADEGFVDRFVACVRALRCGPPAIAWVDGSARGAGVGLLAACDRVLATERASMALTELYFGLTPAAIWPLLCERVSMARLRWAALTGQNLDADHAAALGLVDEVVAGEDALKPCLRALRRTSTQAATVLKRATAPIGAVSLGAERTRVRLQHPEVKERIARFLDGGTPWS
jgi:enoyl-CoA hydratase/carnithine racemase